jgi:hypothetical protein
VRHVRATMRARRGPGTVDEGVQEAKP